MTEQAERVQRITTVLHRVARMNPILADLTTCYFDLTDDLWGLALYAATEETFCEWGAVLGHTTCEFSLHAYQVRGALDGVPVCVSIMEDRVRREEKRYDPLANYLNRVASVERTFGPSIINNGDNAQVVVNEKEKGAVNGKQ